VGKTLIVGELRIPEAQIGKPPVEREHIALVDLLHSPAHHLEMHRLVVERLNDG
jgi:hypothetical protein